MQGHHISLMQQMEQASDTFETMALFMGENVAKDLISESLIYVSIGSNKYIHFYLLNFSLEFNQLILPRYSTGYSLKPSIMNYRQTHIYVLNFCKMNRMSLPFTKSIFNKFWWVKLDRKFLCETSFSLGFDLSTCS